MSLAGPLRALAALIAAALLSGCILTTDRYLLDGEAVPIADGDIVATGYDEADGAFVRAPEPPLTYEHNPDHTYIAGYNGDLGAQFIPYDGGATYIIALVGSGNYYGIARIRDGLMEVRLELTGDPVAEAAAAGRSIPDGIARIRTGLRVPDRDSLGTMLELIENATLATAINLVWIGDGEAPARLIPDGDWYRPTD